MCFFDMTQKSVFARALGPEKIAHKIPLYGKFQVFVPKLVEYEYTIAWAKEKEVQARLLGVGGA